MNIQCVIIEDEPKAMYLLQEYVAKTGYLNLAASFHHPLEALDYLDTHPEIDLLFLDINLPEITGMEMARLIRPSLKIIFTTAHSDYAVTSYEVNAIDYLLKPITYSRFLQGAARAKELIGKDRNQEISGAKDYIFLKSGRTMIQLDWNRIQYVEAMKEYLGVVTTDQKILIYKRMSEFEAMQPRNFKRVHNSFIVNLDKIDKVEDNLVHIGGKQIPIGKSYRDAFLSEIKNRLF